MGAFGCKVCGLEDCICHLFDQYEEEPREVAREELEGRGEGAGGHGSASEGLSDEEEETMEQMEIVEPGSSGAAHGAGAGKRSGPGSRSVTVPAEAMHARLRAAGFVEGRFSGEVTYTRTHQRCPHLSVTVYTSMPARGGDTRALGEDAIRVVAIFQRALPGRDRPYTKLVTKTARVFRTGSVEKVLERTIERAREAYGECNEFLKRGECYECAKRAQGGSR